MRSPAAASDDDYCKLRIEFMAGDLNEEEMRLALFGSIDRPVPTLPRPASSEVKKRLNISSKIRVTLHIGNVFEGAVEEVIYESPSLSALVAELESKKKYKKFRYVTVVSVTRV